jgi:DNA-binding transcriptional MocR family regulator
VAHFLKEGGYDRHIRNLRKKLKPQVEALRACVLKRFPKGTRVTRPKGGTLLWVALPKAIDTFQIYQRALKENILIAPGQLFSVKNKYTHCFRINAGMWNERVEEAICRLGVLCKEYHHKTSKRDESARLREISRSDTEEPKKRSA